MDGGLHLPGGRFQSHAQRSTMTVKQPIYLLFATVGVALAILIVPAGAQADSLIYTTTPGHQVGQTSNNPCIIGDPLAIPTQNKPFPSYTPAQAVRALGGTATSPVLSTLRAAGASGFRTSFPPRSMSAWTRTWEPDKVLKYWTISMCCSAPLAVRNATKPHK